MTLLLQKTLQRSLTSLVAVVIFLSSSSITSAYETEDMRDSLGTIGVVVSQLEPTGFEVPETTKSGGVAAGAATIAVAAAGITFGIVSLLCGALAVGFGDVLGEFFQAALSDESDFYRIHLNEGTN